MNKPVAWMNPKSLECGYGGEVDWEDTGCIPLYTHPVKELTDEEIAYEFDEFCWVGNRRVDFELIVRQVERAILRKAQEK